jgi:zinc transport system substrate-binding protein
MVCISKGGINLKKLFIFTFLFIFGLTTTACTNNEQADIVTTSFVGYDIAKEIVKDKMTVSNVLPWGSELHNYEATPKAISSINNSKLFIYLNLELEPWIENNVSNENALDLSKSYIFAEHKHHDDEHHDDEHHDDEHHDDEDHDDEDHEDEDHEDHGHGSMHFWTDATTYLQLINTVRDSIIAIDKENEEYYTKNALEYYNRIYNLHLELDEFMEENEDITIYFAGHNALNAFAERYHIEIKALTESYSPDADLTIEQISSLKKALVDSDSHYLFIEELVEPKVANKIKEVLEKENFKLTLLELHGYHNITKNQFEEGVNYADLFEQNIKNIKTAFNN